MSNFVIHVEIPNGRTVRILFPAIPDQGDFVQVDRNDDSGESDTYKVVGRTFVQNGGVYLKVSSVIARSLIVDDE